MVEIVGGISLDVILPAPTDKILTGVVTGGHDEPYSTNCSAPPEAQGAVPTRLPGGALLVAAIYHKVSL